MTDPHIPAARTNLAAAKTTLEQTNSYANAFQHELNSGALQIVDGMFNEAKAQLMAAGGAAGQQATAEVARMQESLSRAQAHVKQAFAELVEVIGGHHTVLTLIEQALGQIPG